MRKMLIAGLGLALITSMPGAAQVAHTAALSAQKTALDNFAGWMARGVGRPLRKGPGGEHRVTQTERIGPMLGGTVRVIEGKGFNPGRQRRLQRLCGRCHGTTQKQAYNFRSYAQGRSGDFVIRPTADGYIWKIPAGPVTIRYTATLKDGTWTEIGERIAPGQPPLQFFEMHLRRVGDSSLAEWRRHDAKLARCVDSGARRARNGGVVTDQPVIVLVRPQLGENIGKAARAMLNFGLTEMRLVAPARRLAQSLPPARPPPAPTSCSNRRRCSTASPRRSPIARMSMPPPSASAASPSRWSRPKRPRATIHAGPGRSAILFGPERSGLETDDVAIARTIITVPINPEFGSLNLAQAVILVAYEWSKHVSARAAARDRSAAPAPQEELDGMIGQLDAMLERRVSSSRPTGCRRRSARCGRC